MDVTTDILRNITRPTYVLEEGLLRRNLSLINKVANDADVEIILAFKAYALLEDVPHLS